MTEEHDPGCDTRELLPSLGPNTKPCNCAGRVEPLRVRVARALGWRGLSLWPEYQGGRWHGTPPGTDEPPIYVVPPYGEDTPEGWACTGPFIRQYGLGLSIPRACPAVEGGVVVFAAGARGRDALGPHACAAIAEWVAEHGAAAIASEKA